VFDDIIAPDCPLGKDGGPEAFRNWCTEQYTFCPDLHMTIDEIVTEDDKAVIYVEFQGTLTGKVDGWIEPNGKHVIANVVQYMRFVDGKIIEFRHLQNMLDTFQQVGIVPPTEELIKQAQAKQA